MILNSPYISGSLTVTGNEVVTGSLTVLGGITGAITGSATSSSFATNASLLNGTGSGGFTSVNSFNSYTASNDATVTSVAMSTATALSAIATLASRTGSYTLTSSFNSYTSSNDATVNCVSSTATAAIVGVGALASRTGSYATTGSNTFAGGAYFCSSFNPTGFSTTASLYTDGGLRVTRDAYISGTLYLNNVTVYGTQSVAYISSSQLNIGTNIITVNTDVPSVRFGGLAVYDSGSTGLTGSMLWDSQDNQWIYSNPSGSTYDSAMFLVGPRNTGALGSEVGINCNFLSKGNGLHHMTSSAIFEDGSRTCFYGTTVIGSGGTVCSTMINAGCIGIGTNSPTRKLTIEGSGVQGATTGASIRLDNTTSGRPAIIDFDDSQNLNFIASTDAGNIRFITGTGAGSEKVRIDASGNLMIGSISAGNAGSINLSVGCAGTTAGGLQLWASSAQTHYVQFGDGTAGAGPYAGYVGYSHSTDALLLGTGGATRAIITSAGVSCFSGNVCAPSFVLANGNCITAIRNTGGAAIGVLGFTSGTDTLFIKGGTSGAAASIQFQDTGGTMATFYNCRLGIGTTTPGTALEVVSKAADADRTIPHNVLTITAEQGNAPYGFFGGAILFKNRSYLSGLVESSRIRSVIYDDGAPNNCGGGIWFETTPTPGGTLTPSLKIDYRGIACFSNDISVQGNGWFKGTGNYNTVNVDNTSTTGGGGVYLRQNGTVVGGIGVSGWYNGDTSNDLFVISETGRCIRFGTNGGTERMRITNCGNILINQQSALTGVPTSIEMSGVGSGTPTLQASYNVYANHGAANTTWRGYYVFHRSRGTTAGSVTAVANEDYLGTIRWNGADGTGEIITAEINAMVDGTVGTNDMPTRLTFSTTADGSSSPTERLRITNSGQVRVIGVGKSLAFDTDGSGASTTLATEGQYDFRIYNGRGGASNIDVSTYEIVFGMNGSTNRYRMGNSSFYPSGDNAYTLGYSGQRWSAVWAANGTIQTSDARQKKDIETSNLGLEFINKLRPVSYKWKIGKNVVTSDGEKIDENGAKQSNDIITPVPGTRTHYGLIAQEVKEVLGDNDFGGYVYDENTDTMALRYDQFIAPLIKAVQELKAENDIFKSCLGIA